MNNSILIAAAGTGGHLFPAIGFANTLQKQIPNLEVTFAGHALSNNRFIQERFPRFDIEAAPFQKMPHKLVKAIYANTKGVLQAVAFLKRHQFKAVIGFGSYHTAPVLAAAVLTQTPLFLFGADAIPGRVVRAFSPYARCTGLFYPESQTRLKGYTVPQMLPLRAHISEGVNALEVSHQELKRTYGLHPDHPVLLIIGGSQGAKKLNEMVPKIASLLPQEIQFLHMAGSEAAKQEVKTRYQSSNRIASVHAFEPNIQRAYATADAVLSRAGASTIAEILSFQRPAIFIPYPHAQDNHQFVNATILERLGCGMVVREEELEEYLAERTSVLFDEKVAQRMKQAQQKRFEQLSSNQLVEQVVQTVVT